MKGSCWLLLILLIQCGRSAAPPIVGIALNKAYSPGVLTALDHINREGGIHGVPLQLAGLDPPLSDSASAGDAHGHIVSLLQKEGICAIVGPSDSATAFSTISLVRQSGVPHILTTATNPDLSGISDNTYRLCMSDREQGPQVAQHLQQWGKNRIVVVYVQDDYGRNLSQLVERSFSGQGGMVLASLYHNNAPTPDDLEFLTYNLRELKNQGFGTAQDCLVFICRVPAAKTFVQILGQLDYQVDLFGLDNLASPAFLEAVERYPGKTRISLFYDPDYSESKNKDFQRNYRLHTGFAPDVGNAFAYEAVMLIAEGLRQEGASASNLASYLNKMTKNHTKYHGITGTFSFNDKGDAERNLQLAEAREGQWVLVEGP